MVTLLWVVNIVLILASVALTIVVLMQESKSEGLSGMFGGVTESFFGKNKSKTIEAKLVLITKILGVSIAVLAVAMVLLLRLPISSISG